MVITCGLVARNYIMVREQTIISFKCLPAGFAPPRKEVKIKLLINPNHTDVKQVHNGRIVNDQGLTK